MNPGTKQRATAMGQRAGEDWKQTGVPTPNPFDQHQQPELAQAWRRAYFHAAK